MSGNINSTLVTVNVAGCLALSNEVFFTWRVSEPHRYQNRVDSAMKANYEKCKSSLAALYPEAEPCPIVGYEDMLAVPSDWQEQDELYYEIACIGFVGNYASMRGVERDGPKGGSEGLSVRPRLEVLYVERVERADGSTLTDWLRSDEENWWNEFYNGEWVSFYKVNEVYFSSLEGSLWGAGYCYSLTPKFGQQAGMIYLAGTSSPCNGGSASYTDNLIVRLDYPFKAQLIDAQKQ